LFCCCSLVVVLLAIDLPLLIPGTPSYGTTCLYNTGNACTITLQALSVAYNTLQVVSIMACSVSFCSVNSRSDNFDNFANDSMNKFCEAFSCYVINLVNSAEIKKIVNTVVSAKIACLFCSTLLCDFGSVIVKRRLPYPVQNSHFLIQFNNSIIVQADPT